MESTSDYGYAFRKIQVRTGITSGGLTALEDPGELKAADQVLVKGGFLLK